MELTANELSLARGTQGSNPCLSAGCCMQASELDKMPVNKKPEDFSSGRAGALIGR